MKQPFDGFNFHVMSLNFEFKLRVMTCSIRSLLGNFSGVTFLIFALKEAACD